MNAFQPSSSQLEPIEKRRVVSRTKRHLRQNSYKVMALEITAKICVNLVIITASVSALVQLLPYHWLQQDKLRDVHNEVRLMEGRVKTLQAEFSRNFDPRQAKSVMQQQSYRFNSQQRRIVLINSEPAITEQSDISP